MTVESLRTALHEKYGIRAKKQQCYRAKRKSLDVFEGNHGKSYSLLPSYRNEIRRTNPGSLVTLDYYDAEFNGVNRFRRIFIVFDALRSGFIKGCRPFIGLDGCFLKGPHGGVFLSAVALDGNNGLFPIAYAVVESEGNETWTFFLDNLKDILGADAHAKHWTIMSDMQKGIEVAISNLFPEASHRICCRHLFNNFRKDNPRLLLKIFFWKTARSCNELEFNDAMNQMNGICTEAYDCLMDRPLEIWSRVGYGETSKSDHIINNLTESFNNWVGHYRSKPILNMLEWIMIKLMVRIQKRYQKALAWKGNLTPNAWKKLNKSIQESRMCRVCPAGREEFEVHEVVGVSVVNLNLRTCSCRAWQISGIPYRHAAGAISWNRQDPEHFCDPCYSKDTNLLAHSGMIHPLMDEKMWPKTPSIDLYPPKPRRLPGRPRKNRRREQGEPAPASTSEVPKRSSVVTCKYCLQTGHNRRTYQRAQTARERATAARGRAASARGRAQTATKNIKSQTQGSEGAGTSGVTQQERWKKCKCKRWKKCTCKRSFLTKCDWHWWWFSTKCEWSQSWKTAKPEWHQRWKTAK
ncbi:uncharacterized protein LOC132314433 [Cornus florida]|uniref:uncharacterized protein LOC132314433 n=1 Tax=Cornus florida TaxID=4283 RepID=UPI00289FD1FE|nr:uncharacterized protein LOC132314433 [Cornus florida]